MMRIKINGEALIAAALYLLIFYLCLPFSMVILNSLLIRLLVITATVLFITGMVLMNKWNYLITCLLLFAFIFFYWKITWSFLLDTLSYIYYSFASLSFIFGGMILYNSGDEVLLRHLFLFITIVFFVTAITSIVGLNVYPLAAREFARGSTYDTSLDFTIYKNIYRKMNIVSWSQAYGMLFALPSSLMVWKKRRKPFYLVSLVAIAVMLVASQITYAVLLAIVFIIAIFLSRKSSRKSVIIYLAFALIIIFVLLNLDSVLTMAVDFSEKASLDFLASKLNDMKVLLLYRTAVGNARSRGLLYQMSFNTFLSSPVVGLMLGGKASLEKIGFHSEFFDFLGTFGLIGLIGMVVSFVGYFGFIRTTDKDYRRDLTIIYLGFIVLFIFDPVFNSPQIFAGAFLYPLLASRYCGMSDVNQKHRKIISFRRH